MNTNTGEIYRTLEEIEAAQKRGEPVVSVSAQVAQLVEDGEKWDRARARRRAKNKAARASRRANRPR
jgi:hypothetical protein